jgi:hypothetical protein
MAVSKSELTEQFVGMYQYLCKYENVTDEANECETVLEQSKEKLRYRKGALVRNIIIPIVFLGGALGIIYWTGNLQRLLAVEKLIFSGLIGGLQFLVFAILVIASVISFIKIPVYLLLIPKSKHEVEKNQGILDDIIAEANQLFDSMENEKADTERIFPDYYPPSRYIKYGIDSLNSGRADNFKEVMQLIDDLCHREKMEAEAERQTRYAAGALAAARSAEMTAQRAASDAATARRNSEDR